MASVELPYKYALKTIFNAHDADVRVVKAACIPDSGIVSGSRDNCVKVWTPEGKIFRDSHSFYGATNYVSSLCIIPSSDQYPTGLILAGSHDCSIYGFTSTSFEPVFRLLGHSGPVCSLSSGKFGFIVSGSWDKTARVWSGQQCTLTLQGHLQAVWATDVFPTQNLILTGSADHTIRLWRSAVCERTFSGHTDCVRGLAVVSDLKFLSCSNDNTIRQWLTSGECIEVYKAHSDYIYDIALLSNGTDFASCGEDQNIKVWKDGKCVQTFVVAAKSLWSLTCLSNGDLAVGTSDGKIYVFEKVNVDFFENAVGITDMNILPPENQSALDGETVIMYDNKVVDMYICQYLKDGSMKIQKQPLDFQIISDTLLKKPENPASNPVVASNTVQTKKTDYVFDVNVEETNYKLAFNKGENPWDVANKFVAEHNLLSDHVNQIVEFIIQNTGSSFVNEFFPVKSYLKYLKVNLAGLKAKLLEFSNIVPKVSYISPADVEELVSLASAPDELSENLLSILDKVLLWDDEFLFPVLDLMRIGVTSKGLQAKIHSKDFLNHTLHILKSSNRSVNKVLIVKIFCNMFGLDETQDILTSYQDKIFECVKDAFSTLDLNIQKAGSALFLNFAIASYNGSDINTNIYCLNIIEILNYLVDSEALTRVLMAIGTVCARNPLAITFFRSLEIKDALSKFNEYSLDPKIGQMLKLLYADF